MKRILFALLLSLFIGSCANAQDKADSFEKVFNTIASPQVFNASFNKLMHQLDGLCKQSTRMGKEQYKYGNVECVKEVGIESFTVSGGDDIGLIQASFFGTEKCTYMKNILVKNFGKPTKTVDACALSWRLKPSKKGEAQRYASFEIDQNKNLIYFEIGAEQGL